MLSCLKPSPPPPTPSTNYYFSSQGNSADNTPRSNNSPTINIIEQFTLTLQTKSFNEIRTTFEQHISFDRNIDIFFDEPQLLKQVLKPSHDCVQEALSLIRPNSLTHLVTTTCFQHTEHTSRLCLLLYSTIHRARILYNPIHNLLEHLPPEFDSHNYSLSDSQCKISFEVFLQFNNLENPFLSQNSHNFDDTRKRFTQLRQQLDHRLRKSKSMVNVIVAAVAGPKRETVRIGQLKGAARSVCALQYDVDTIGCLVTRLCDAVENDRLYIQMGLGRNMDKYLIQEILKQLRRNRSGFVQQLVVLEEHLFSCFAAINRVRSRLLQEIQQHQIKIQIQADFHHTN